MLWMGSLHWRSPFLTFVLLCRFISRNLHIAGIVLFAFSYFGNKVEIIMQGVTFQPVSTNASFLNAEALILHSQVYSQNHSRSLMEFGGIGSGGGSGGKF
jgi:hypothetical protein